jgi:hypothetical protein
MKYKTVFTEERKSKSTKANGDDNPAHHNQKYVAKLLSLLGIDTGGLNNLLISPGILTLFDADNNISRHHHEMRLGGFGVKFNYPILLGEEGSSVEGEFLPREEKDCIKYAGIVTTKGLTGKTETVVKGEFFYSSRADNFITDKQLENLKQDGEIRKRGVYQNEEGKRVFVLEETINASYQNLVSFCESLGIGDIEGFCANGESIVKLVASFIPPKLISMLKQYKEMECKKFNEKDCVYLYRRQSLFFNNEKKTIRKIELDHPYHILGAIHNIKTQRKSNTKLNIYSLDTLILTPDKTPVCAGTSFAIEYVLKNEQ